MSWKLKTLQGYKLFKQVDSSISHAFFIRHLKLYSSSEGQQGIKVALTHQMIDDMGLSMAAKKTKIISLARKDVGLRPSDDVMIEDLVDSRQPYQGFLAWKKLSDKEHKFALRTAEKKDIRRVSVILDTTMPDQNKVKAINIFVEPVLAFFYPSAFLLSRRP